MGIEPTSLAWKARALPLSYTRLRQGFGGRARQPKLKRRLARQEARSFRVLVKRAGKEKPYRKRFLAKARPDPVLRYFSNAIAFSASLNAV